MKKNYAIACCPAVFGLLLLTAAHLDIYLYGKGIISVRQAIGHEALYFLLGVVSALAVFALSIKWLVTRKWLLACFGFISATGFFVFFILAGESGAAILHAT
jgi:hypothetical protein